MVCSLHAVMSDPYRFPHSLPNPQPRPALPKKDQRLPTWDSWHLPACCFTFASVCYKWVCWTLKYLAETPSKPSQDAFTAPFSWDTAVLKWSWALVGLKGSCAGRQAGRLGWAWQWAGDTAHGTVGVLSCAPQVCPTGVCWALTIPLFRLRLSLSWTYKAPALMMTVMTVTVVALMMLSASWGSLS